MKFGHTAHDYQMDALIPGDDKIWRERQVCSECPWEIRYLILEKTPEDEPSHPPHRMPCWCPLCMHGKHP